MLRIHVDAQELWNEATNEFVRVKEQTICLEHSLVSVSKWESKWKIPFLSENKKTPEQLLHYVKCMTTTQNVDPNAYLCLTNADIESINDYIADKMTATWFSDDKKKGNSGEQITSELIYYWMVALNIPWECQKWHLNRLLTLIKVCNVKNTPPKKVPKNAAAQKRAALNAQRRAKLGSKG